MARRVAGLACDATLSYAGRVTSPMEQPIPVRSGGFGGVDGLARYLRDTQVTHVIDATHPFAAGISQNAAQASAMAGLPLIALTRPQWTPEPGDNWHAIDHISFAPQYIGNKRQNVFLAIGRQEIDTFAIAPQHRYLLRVVDPPERAFRLPDHHIEIARGPFRLADDLTLLRRHGIEVIVSKNSGGSGARAKIDAARQLGLPVIMVNRPRMPNRREVSEVADVIKWLGHSGTDLGV